MRTAVAPGYACGSHSGKSLSVCASSAPVYGRHKLDLVLAVFLQSRLNFQRRLVHVHARTDPVYSSHEPEQPASAPEMQPQIPEKEIARYRGRIPVSAKLVPVRSNILKLNGTLSSCGRDSNECKIDSAGADQGQRNLRKPTLDCGCECSAGT
jgi:hypothetical protein